MVDTLPEGYTTRIPTRDDASDVAQLIAACQLAAGGETDMTVEELLHDWEGLDLAEEAVLVTAPDGRAAAYADVLNRRYVRVSVYGYVHPEHRGLGLGAYLVRWGEAWVRDRLDRAPDRARVVVEHFVREPNDAARQLLAAHGYEAIRGYYVMAIDLHQTPPPPEWPAGVAVRTFVQGRDEQALFEAGEDAFRDTWSRPPGTYEGWIGPTRAEGFDPALWFLAEDAGSGEIAGYCLCRVTTGVGWVSSIGVRRPWRQRGLGLALLRHAFAEFHRRGVRRVGLSVDGESPTGAPRLYARAGMRVTQHHTLHRKEARPGEDLSTQPEAG